MLPTRRFDDAARLSRQRQRALSAATSCAMMRADVMLMMIYMMLAATISDYYHPPFVAHHARCAAMRRVRVLMHIERGCFIP